MQQPQAGQSPIRTEDAIESSGDGRSRRAGTLCPENPLGDWFDEWQVDEELRQARRIVARHRRERLPVSPPALIVFDPLRGREDDQADTRPVVAEPSITVDGRRARRWAKMTMFALIFVAAGLAGGSLAVLARQAAPGLVLWVVLAELGLGGLAAVLWGRTRQASEHSC